MSYAPCASAAARVPPACSRWRDMELVLSPEDEAFRQEVRAFLADRMPPEFATRTDTGLRMSKEDHVRWQRILFEKGWIAPGWPVEHGGTGWTAMQKHIFERSEEHPSELKSLMRQQ